MRRAAAAIYCRVSTDEQAERGTSLTDQQTRCTAFCAAEDWPVAEVFIDEGISGATTERPELGRLIAAASRGLFNRVVVTDPDRLSRDLVDGLVIERDLTHLGVEVVYLIQPTMGTLERQIRGVIAEEERRKIRDRTSRGLRATAAAGGWPGGPPPFGYRIQSNDDGHSILVINNDEAAVLRHMIDALVDQRLTTWQVAAELNASHTPTASAGRALSHPAATRWTHRRVRDLLKTARAIAGQWTYSTAAGSYELAVPAIVTEARLQQLQERLAETSTGRNATKKKHIFLLARRVTSVCGHPMHSYARPDGTGRVYRCSKSTADQGPDRCDCRRVSADAIETATWDTITAELTDPHRLQRLAGLAAEIPDADTNLGDLRAMDRKIKRVESAIGSDIANLLADGVDLAAIRTATAELETQLATLRSQRAQLVHWAATRADQTQQIDRLQRLANSARTALATPTPELKANVITLLDIRVTVTGHVTCSTCNGRGLIPAAVKPNRRAKGNTGEVCPTCRRYRTLPTINISGLLPTTDQLPDHPDTNGMPFTLHSIG